MILLFAIIGAISNRMRGGLTDRWFHIPKIVNEVIFSLSMTGLMYYYDRIDYLTILFCTIGMLIGRTFGWGKYLNQMVFKKYWTGTEIKPIDWLISKLKLNPIPEAVVWLGVRGLIWSGLVSIPLKSLSVALIGASMGILYLICMNITEKLAKMKIRNYSYYPQVRNFTRDDGWGLGEWVFGFVLWGTVALEIAHVK